MVGLTQFDGSWAEDSLPARIPFTPSFGEKPPMIVGRSQIIGQFDKALSLGDI